MVYTVRVTNEGSGVGESLVLTDVLPPQVDYVQGSLSQGGRPIPDQNGRLALADGWPVAGRSGPGTLGPNETVTVRFRARIRAEVEPSVQVTNRATLSAENEEQAVDTADFAVEGQPNTGKL